MPAPGPPNVFKQPRSSNQTLEFLWSPPTSDGGSPITHYRLQLNAETPIVVAASVRYYMVTGLTNGTDYTASIEASNDNQATWSDKAYFRTFQPGSAKPGAPSTASAVAETATTATVSWTAPTGAGSLDSPIQWYAITAVGQNPAASTIKVSAAGTDRSYYFSNLTATQPYVFDVYAVNCPGYSPARRTNQIGAFVTTSSLTMYMDAANSLSYGGSGTTWSNIASTYSTVNYSMSGAVARSTIVSGATSNLSMTFTGGYVAPSATMGGMLTAGASNETREIWFYWSGNSCSYVTEEDDNVPGGGWSDTQGTISGTTLTIGLYNAGFQQFNVSTGITSNQWYHLVYQYSATSNLIMGYLNGVRTLSNSSGRQFPGANYFIIYGQPGNGGTGGAFNGGIPIIRYYNRILSSNEINDNFTAERGRFGL